MPLALKSYLSPFFVARYYRLKDIQNIVSKYQFKGNLFDFGCGSKPYKKYFAQVDSYVGIDFSHYSINNGFEVESPDYYFGSEYLNDFKIEIEDNKFDITTAFQTLEHHKKPLIMIEELIRITKIGGYILITAPFLEGIHEEPNDFQRFTKYGLIELFQSNNCEIIEILEEGGLFSTVSKILNEYINSRMLKSKISFFLYLPFYVPFLIFQYLSIVFDRFVHYPNICFNYLVLARKK